MFPFSLRTVTAIILVLLAALLAIGAAELLGLIPAYLSGWETWVLRGLVLILSIGILLAAARIHSISLRQHEMLEGEVAQRTGELRLANQKLEEEIAHRKIAEETLAKQAEEKLTVSEARFRAMFHDATVGLGIMDLACRIIDANPAMCRTFGWTHDEMIGMNSAEMTLAEDNPEAIRLFDELLKGQRDSYEVDRRYIRKDGGIFWAHVTMSSVKGSDGRPIFLVSMLMDIDEQMKMQERIRESDSIPSHNGSSGTRPRKCGISTRARWRSLKTGRWMMSCSGN
jgi:PAS domain S-box-containing protein